MRELPEELGAGELAAGHRGAMLESSQGTYPLEWGPLTILSRRVSDAMISR
jgi:hypothetical protein